MVRKVVRTIGATYLKRNCARILDEVYNDGVEFIITKRGIPVARLLPPRERVRELRAEGRR
jgi:prevent-host-death family protein